MRLTHGHPGLQRLRTAPPDACRAAPVLAGAGAGARVGAAPSVPPPSARPAPAAPRGRCCRWSRSRATPASTRARSASTSRARPASTWTRRASIRPARDHAMGFFDDVKVEMDQPVRTAGDARLVARAALHRLGQGRRRRGAQGRGGRGRAQVRARTIYDPEGTSRGRGHPPPVRGEGATSTSPSRRAERPERRRRRRSGLQDRAGRAGARRLDRVREQQQHTRAICAAS